MLLDELEDEDEDELKQQQSIRIGKDIRFLRLVLSRMVDQEADQVYRMLH